MIHSDFDLQTEFVRPFENVMNDIPGSGRMLGEQVRTFHTAVRDLGMTMENRVPGDGRKHLVRGVLYLIEFLPRAFLNFRYEPTRLRVLWKLLLISFLELRLVCEDLGVEWPSELGFLPPFDASLYHRLRDLTQNEVKEGYDELFREDRGNVERS